MNKYLLLLIGFFLLNTSTLFAQSNNKLKPALAKQILNKDASEELKIWIYFSDKGGELDLQLAKAKTAMSKRTLDRRKRSLKNKSLVSFYDIPVREEYIEVVTPFLTKVKHKSKWLNAISAMVQKDKLDDIAALDIVAAIDIVRTGRRQEAAPVVPMTEDLNEAVARVGDYNLDYGPSLTQLEQINVPFVHDLGYNGTGITVCVLDAGFRNWEIHPNFTDVNIVDTYDFVNDDPNVDDQPTDMGSGSHGRATLSTIGGYTEGQLIGPAYGANFLLAKTENTESETTVEEDNWVAAAEWAEGLGADITSTSLGYLGFDDGTGYEPDELDGATATITLAGDIMAGMGVLVVNSAGNSGGGVTTIGAPADGFDVMAIGAVNSGGMKAGFSSVGPTADGRIKPDVMAMGVAVVVATGSDTYGTSNGTSFSCPLVAGAAAVLWEMVPTATNMEIYEALKMSADNAATPNNEYGWGIINLYAAFEYLTNPDSEAPVALCQNAIIELDETGTVTIEAITIDAGSTDNIGIASYELSTEAVSCADLGDVSIVLTVTDGAGNSSNCTAMVNVVDYIFPIPDMETLPAIMAECEVTEITMIPTASDNCAGVIMDGMNDAALPVTTQGSTTFIWTYDDGNGNAITQSQEIIINDATNPTVMTQDITVDLDGAATVEVLASQIDAGSFDNCGIANVMLDLTSFSAVGMYPVVLEVEDVNGNFGTGMATVTVVNTMVGVADNFFKNNLDVFPNPANEKVSIVFDLPNVTNLDLSFFNATGQLMKSVTAYESSEWIDLSGFSAGLYVVRVEVGGVFHFGKLVVE